MIDVVLLANQPMHHLMAVSDLLQLLLRLKQTPLMENIFQHSTHNPSPSSSLGGVVLSYFFWEIRVTLCLFIIKKASVITCHYLQTNIYVYHMLSILICFIYIGHHMYVLLYGLFVFVGCALFHPLCLDAV